MGMQQGLCRSILLMVLLPAAMAAADLTVDIPEGCVSWFDGCNVCVVGKFDEEIGEHLLACTKKYCPPELIEQPYCLRNDQDEPPPLFNSHSPCF